MPNAISQREALAYGMETTWGTTPTGVGASQFLRFNTVNSKYDKTTVESGEISNSAEIADLIEVSQRGGLTFNGELSFSTLDDMLSSLFNNAWTANVLTVGTTRKSFTIERQFSDIARFHTLSGGIADRIQMSIAIGKIMSTTVEVSAKPLLEGAASAFTGGGTLAANTNPIFDPISSIQLLQEGGAGNIAGVTEVTMDLQRPIIDMAQINSVNPLDLQSGQFRASGTFSCYFADATYIAKHLSHVTTSLQFAFSSNGANQKYAFLFNKVKLSVSDVPNGGPNQPLIQQVAWTAIKDATNTTCKITRTP